MRIPWEAMGTAWQQMGTVGETMGDPGDPWQLGGSLGAHGTPRGALRGRFEPKMGVKKLATGNQKQHLFRLRSKNGNGHKTTLFIIYEPHCALHRLPPKLQFFLSTSCKLHGPWQSRPADVLDVSDEVEIVKIVCQMGSQTDFNFSARARFWEQQQHNAHFLAF